MIPQFPKFKKLELSDKEDVEKNTVKYPPYSDFNFVSMWSWDIREKMRISELNGNLVVKFTDYLTSEPFYSFLGNNKANETAEQLLNLSIKEGLTPKIKLVPEEAAKELDKEKFQVSEDRDHFDYILDTKLTKELKGEHHRKKRGAVNNLLKKHNISIKQLKDFSSIILFLEKLEKEDDEFKIKKEVEAIVRLLKLESKFNLILLVVYCDGEIVGFVINELLPHNKHSIGHFLKVNSKFHHGLSTFLLKNISELLHQKGFDLLNIEQDLGMPGLRFWKQNHSPSHFLKKFVVVYK